MTGIFGSYQKTYADDEIETFPVEIGDDRKKPMLNHWRKVGLKASTAHVQVHMRTMDEHGVAWDRYQMTLPTKLDVNLIEQAYLKLVGADDEDWIYPERLVVAMPRARAIEFRWLLGEDGPTPAPRGSARASFS